MSNSDDNTYDNTLDEYYASLVSDNNRSKKI